MGIICAAVVGQLVSIPQKKCTELSVEKTKQLCIDFFQDNPLYLSAMTPSAEDDLFKLHTIVHCSLDAVEEKGSDFLFPPCY